MATSMMFLNFRVYVFLKNSPAQLCWSQEVWFNITAAGWHFGADALWVVSFLSLQTFPALTAMKGPFGDMLKMCQVPLIHTFCLHLQPLFGWSYALLLHVLLWPTSEQVFQCFLPHPAKHSGKNLFYSQLEKHRNLLFPGWLYLGDSGAHLCRTFTNPPKTCLWWSVLIVTTSGSMQCSQGDNWDNL